MDFNNTGAMRSPFSPRVRQSITGRRPISLSSAKKNQSKFMQSAGEQAGDIIYKTPLITVETYGLPLPVMVTEALTFGSGEVSVRMSECGWCWVVCGRRVLAWPHSAPAAAPPGALAARELTLPQTDLAHKADLVMLFYADGAQMPSCVGVSPEGVVRFWPSVAQEGAHSDVCCELAGQECELLTSASGALVLATTSCTLVLLTPTAVNGRQSVVCRTLRPPSGWLGGIGRRVSLMFFGSMPAHAETKLVGVVGVGGDAHAPHLALVAGGPTLQLWRGAELHEHSLRRALADCSPHLAPHGEGGGVEVGALDVRARADGSLLLLVAAGSVQRPRDVRLAIAHISIADPARPVVVSLGAVRGWGAEAEERAPRFLPLDSHAVLYSHKYIALASSAMSSDKVEYVNVAAEGDRILGAELCGARPLLFSRKHGVLLLSRADTAPPSVCDSDMYDGNLSLFEIDPHEVSAVTTDACGKLKAAFLFHVRREAAACRALLHELFPAAPAPAPPDDVDAALDRTVVRIAREMLDDVPAGDPRWRVRSAGATVVALGSSAALQIASQLQDKKRAFSLFVDFLRATQLWQRLGRITGEEGGVVRTTAALGALAEQLAAAIALRRLQQAEHAQLIDAAIYQVVCGAAEAEAEEEPEVGAALAAGALAPSDASYRRVSRTARVLRAVARAPPPPDAAAAAAHVLHALTVLTAVVGEMCAARAAWRAAGGAAPAPARGPRALLPALLDLQKRAVSQYARGCPDATLRARVVEAAGALAALALAEAEPLRREPRTAPAYEAMRRDAILPFMEEGQTERAAALAEKFQDFELLVELCVRADDVPRLRAYIDKYADEGMPETAYAWLFARGGRHAALLVRRLGGARLAGWLRAAPARAPLAALQHLAAGRARAAADLLLDLADAHTDSLARMTTMASLGKLCLAAAGAAEGEGAGGAAWRRADARLALAEQQAALPAALRRRHGLEADGRVLPPDHLVLMYADADRGDLTEYDYKKALDLTDYVADMERRDDLRLRVWCACARHSTWAESGAEAPLEELHDNMFFRLIDLVHVMGGDLELVLPPLEDILTAPELAELASDARFHYQLKYGYECVHAERARDAPAASPVSVQ